MALTHPTRTLGSVSKGTLLIAGTLALPLAGCGTSTTAEKQGAHGASGGAQLTRTEALVPEFGDGATRQLKVVATAANGLNAPRDLEFNPLKPSELWVVNLNTEGVVIFHGAGTDGQRAETRKDSYRYHFMSKVSSLAFGTLENFATCQESRNEAAGYRDFMGPTLWSSDLAIFANVNQRFVPEAMCVPDMVPGTSRWLLGSHIDMLHQSPLCMGIAHSKDNGFWVFDGLYGHLMHYDFVKDHGPGYDDHSDGRIRRYSDVKLKRVAGVPSHIVVDAATAWYVDGGGNTLTRIDP